MEWVQHSTGLIHTLNFARVVENMDKGYQHLFCTESASPAQSTLWDEEGVPLLLYVIGCQWSDCPSQGFEVIAATILTGSKQIKKRAQVKCIPEMHVRNIPDTCLPTYYNGTNLWPLSSVAVCFQRNTYRNGTLLTLWRHFVWMWFGQRAWENI